MAEWTVLVSDSAMADLKWIGRPDSRLVLTEAMNRLSNDPLTESPNQKRLRPNPKASHELRLRGKYRLLDSVDESDFVVVIEVVGVKTNERLLVRGEDYREHESDFPG
jgi:mRNA-degrading endonuclease RelE of RelBE toxin-antitoxin system